MLTTKIKLKSIMAQNQDSSKEQSFLLAGLKNLRQGLTGLSMDKFVVDTLEMLMHLEREDYLQELKQKNERDKGNGTYPRSFKSLSKNALVINIPRTRTGDFKPFVLEFLKYHQEQVNELVLTLYKKGLTTRDVQDILKEFFSEDVSYAKVCDLAERFHAIRQAWEAMTLDSHYKVAYADAIYITVRRGNSYSKEATHIVYGVKDNNKRELLYLGVNPTESAQSWGEALAHIKGRGVETIDMIVADGIQGLSDEVHKYFPGAHFQKCITHKMRHTLNKIRPADKPQFASELKQLFNHFDESSQAPDSLAQQRAQFVEKWQGRYPFLTTAFSETEMEYYFSYLHFPIGVRRMIYTTNSIENLNKLIRKATKNKLSFEKPERLLDFVFIVIKEHEDENWMRHPVTAFSTFSTRETQSY